MLQVPLFVSNKERLFAVGLLLVIACFSLWIEFQNYEKLLAKKRYFTTATVLLQYEKNNKTILKLKAKEGFTFFTSTKEAIKDLKDRKVKILLFRPKKSPTFLQFLHHFYYPSYILQVLPKDRRLVIKEYIAKQHEAVFFKELFGALFLATSLSKKSRDKLANFGISHLVAISGFHLGLISGIVTFLLSFLLRPLWQRFMPFSNLYLFASFLAIGVAGRYMAFVGFLPSLVRSFFMMFLAFLLYVRGMKVFSFEFLAWVGLVILALFPRFAFTYAFWLSVSGVFMIYLFFHYFKDFKWWQAAGLLNLWVFWLMLPISMAIFEKLSIYQLFSPLLTLLFTLFYPLEAILHLLGFGGVLDSSLTFLMQKSAFIDVVVPGWFMVLYIGLLVLSIYSRAALWGALLSVLGVLVYNVA